MLQARPSVSLVIPAIMVEGLWSASLVESGTKWYSAHVRKTHSWHTNILLWTNVCQLTNWFFHNCCTLLILGFSFRNVLWCASKHITCRHQHTKQCSLWTKGHIFLQAKLCLEWEFRAALHTWRKFPVWGTSVFAKWAQIFCFSLILIWCFIIGIRVFVSFFRSWNGDSCQSRQQVDGGGVNFSAKVGLEHKSLLFLNAIKSNMDDMCCCCELTSSEQSEQPLLHTQEPEGHAQWTWKWMKTIKNENHLALQLILASPSDWCCSPGSVLAHNALG